MKKYYLDKQFQDSIYKDTYYSYESGAFDNMYFDTKEEAEAYAKYCNYMLENNEIFVICEVVKMFEIEYYSDNILIISNNSNEEFWVICLDGLSPKIVKINAWLVGLDNDTIEESIKQVLNDCVYDINYEIEEYRHSKLYQSIKEYNQE